MNARNLICEPSPAVPATTWWEYLRKQVQELNSTGPSERKSWRLPSPDKLMQSWSLSFPGGGARPLDLLNTLRELENWKVSVIAMNGMAFDLSSPYGRMLATFLSGIAEFERDLISERVKSGLAVAKARGKRLGRQAGVRPKSDRLLPMVVAMRAEGRSYRWIARELGISKNTVADIVQRHRANA
ncbi:resolvase [Escherichia coli]|nr:resolvase [Escherichia coli]